MGLLGWEGGRLDGGKRVGLPLLRLTDVSRPAVLGIGTAAVGGGLPEGFSVAMRGLGGLGGRWDAGRRGRR